MKKDARLTFRVRSIWKKELEQIAAHEGQSVARISEAFLIAGLDSYRKEGRRFVQRYLGRINTARDTKESG